MRLLLALLVAMLPVATARAAVIPYDSVHGTEITFEEATVFVDPPGYYRGLDLETFYGPLGVHFFQAAAFRPVLASNTVILANQPFPCLIAGLCPPFVQILPPVDSPLAADHRWRPIWVTFDAPITEFGFQEVPLPGYSAAVIDSMRAYRGGAFVGEESFPLPVGFGNVGLAVSFTTPFDLVILDRQVMIEGGAPVFVDGPSIDNVRFAPAIVGPVPEPGTCALALAGLAAFGLKRRAAIGRLRPKHAARRADCDHRRVISLSGGGT